MSSYPICSKCGNEYHYSWSFCPECDLANYWDGIAIQAEKAAQQAREYAAIIRAEKPHNKRMEKTQTDVTK